MKILILSDSHGKTRQMADIVRKHRDNVEFVLFLGDYVGDIDAISADFSGQIHAVAGNCDFLSPLPREMTLELGNRRIWMTHGDRFNVKLNLNKIQASAAERRADVCLFGHTHDAVVMEKNGILFINPGSISEPRGRGGKSYAMLEIIGESCLAKIIEI